MSRSTETNNFNTALGAIRNEVIGTKSYTNCVDKCYQGYGTPNPGGCSSFEQE